MVENRERDPRICVDLSVRRGKYVPGSTFDRVPFAGVLRACTCDGVGPRRRYRLGSGMDDGVDHAFDGGHVLVGSQVADAAVQVHGEQAGKVLIGGMLTDGYAALL